jgi:hypothetical protein
VNAVPGTLTLRALAFDGTEHAATRVDTTAPANAATGTPVATLSLTPDLLAQCADLFVHAVFTPASEHAGFAAENFLLLAEPKDLRLPDAGLTWEVTPEPTSSDGSVHGGHVMITAQRFAPFVWLHIEGLPPENASPAFRDNGFHLAPGQTRTFSVDGLPAHLERNADALRAALRVRSL